MKDCNPTICRKIDNKVIQMEGVFIEKSTLKRFGSTEPSSGPWGVILAMLIQWLIFNIASITPHGPADSSVEPKRYSVDFSINLSFHMD